MLGILGVVCDVNVAAICDCGNACMDVVVEVERYGAVGYCFVAVNQ